MKLNVFYKQLVSHDPVTEIYSTWILLGLECIIPWQWFGYRPSSYLLSGCVHLI